jgi:hypothetical protein
MFRESVVTARTAEISRSADFSDFFIDIVSQVTSITRQFSAFGDSTPSSPFMESIAIVATSLL